MAFNIFATATSDIPLANLDANFTLIGAAAAVSTLYPTASTSITYGTAGTTHYFSGSGLSVTGTLSASGTASFSAGLINSGTTVARFQSTTSGAPAGSTGSGVEIYAGNIFSYNRTTSAFVPLTIEASALTVNSVSTFGGLITINGNSTGNMLKIVASASGTRGDATFQTWYRTNGTTRKGYFGYGSADSADIVLGTEEAGGYIQLASPTAVTGGLSSTGTYTSTIGNNSLVTTNASATTGYLYDQRINTSGNIVWGVEGATPALIVGSTAYDAVLRGKTGLSFSGNDGAALHMRLSSAGALNVSGLVTGDAGFAQIKNTGLMANGAQYTIGPAYATGMFVIREYQVTGDMAIYLFSTDASTPVRLVDGSSNWSAAPSGASFNVWMNGANLVIQNTAGGNRAFKYSLLYAG
tara:strand:- start:2258 stop:3490 length:1233 start_codon:yes stop_codon:yes gene_type:complete